MSIVKIGLIGAGSIGVRHIMAIDALPDAVLVAIGDPSPAAQKIGTERNIPVFDDADKMLSNGGIDAVIIATPTERHHQDVMAALRYKVTVLVEKPITATLTEARDITQFAAQQNCHVLVGHQRRYYPCAAEARKIIQSGQIGTLIGVTGQWTTKKDDDYYAPEWRRDVKAGPILTNLIHEFDLLRYICGDITSVSAELTRHEQNFAKEDAAAISLKFANQAVGTFFLSDRTPSPWTWEMALGESERFPKTGQNAIRFMGSTGALEFPNLVLWTYPEGIGDWRKETKPQSIETLFIDAYIAQCKHLCAVTRGEEAPIIDAENGTKSLEATLAATTSAETGNRITLG
jgi:predicted dehydrogenase